jgi:hemolysin activation/secretion protein
MSGKHVGAAAGYSQTTDGRAAPALVVALLWLAMLLPGAAVQAANPPLRSTAEEYLRQIERERQLRERNEPAPDVRTGPQPVPDSGHFPAQESPCFAIDSITLDGEDAERFQWTLHYAFVNGDGDVDLELPRCLGATSINLIMRRMQHALIARGFVTTRILAQPQDLNSGRLTLTVLPGRIRHIRMADESQGRAAFRHALPMREGAILNLRDLEQALENFRRVPTAQSSLDIVPATEKTAQPGESDVVVDWRQTTPLRATFSVDDSGSETTGKYLGNVTLSADNWLSMNDLFYVNYMEDMGGGMGGERGTQGHTLHYSFPLGYWQFAITASENDYHQSVAGLNQTYSYSGESSNGDARLSRLLYRDSVRKVSLSFGGWTRSSRNFIDDTEVEVQRRRMAGWLAGIVYSEFIGAAMLDLNLDFRRGTGAHESLQAPEENFNEGTARPEIILANTRLQLPFMLGEQRLRLNTLWRAQWNRTPLVPQDNFSIGSRYSVRGFDGEQVLAADRGWLLRNDLGWRIGGQELYLGADYGQVSGDDADRLVGTHLGGAVIGLRGQYRWIAYDVFAGAPWNKPERFITDSHTSGFNISIGF